MNTLLHYAFGAAVIATVAILSGLHTISGDAALGVIISVTGVLLGTGATSIGADQAVPTVPATKAPASPFPDA